MVFQLEIKSSLYVGNAETIKKYEIMERCWLDGITHGIWGSKWDAKQSNLIANLNWNGNFAKFA